MASPISYFSIKTHYVEHHSINCQAMVDGVKEGAWFQTIPGEKAVLATQITSLPNPGFRI